MKVHVLKRTQVVDRPLPEVFAFFERPENLSVITPPSMAFEILTPAPMVMQTGAVIDYTVRIFGVRRHWRTLITFYDPPHRFVDVQLKGPYLFWHHEHTFQDEAGRTLITDEVRYVLPMGWTGVLVHRLFVKRRLAAIFDHRERTIRHMFSCGMRSDT